MADLTVKVEGAQIVGEWAPYAVFKFALTAPDGAPLTSETMRFSAFSNLVSSLVDECPSRSSSLVLPPGVNAPFYRRAAAEVVEVRGQVMSSLLTTIVRDRQLRTSAAFREALPILASAAAMSGLANDAGAAAAAAAVPSARPDASSQNKLQVGVPVSVHPTSKALPGDGALERAPQTGVQVAAPMDTPKAAKAGEDPLGLPCSVPAPFIPSVADAHAVRDAGEPAPSLRETAIAHGPTAAHVQQKTAAPGVPGMEPADCECGPRKPEVVLHKLVDGDTLPYLALRYGTSVAAIRRANAPALTGPFADLDTLPKDASIVIPALRSAGEDDEAVARRREAEAKATAAQRHATSVRVLTSIAPGDVARCDAEFYLQEHNGDLAAAASHLRADLEWARKNPRGLHGRERFPMPGR
eukprot:TRINITY_DN33654_c0_g1_i1.p1 TRINITY_DN33654_c0_g1~~TRINITY_DN33654_c0_g1_i1.p1  ORF type:complete len:412 (-),score=55.88 TRINITY_DN33654_c0_g1_i1:193-1428(-)